MNTRKTIRLENYDYGQNGAYFITICVQNRLPILAEISELPVGASIARPCSSIANMAGEQCSPLRTVEVKLSELGHMVDEAIQSIPAHYPSVTVEKYVIMPNHVHMLLRIDHKNGRAMLAPTVSEIIRQMKGYVTKRCGKTVWQKSFYDHVIRTEQDYLDTWKYIDGNPAGWREDELYISNECNK